MAIQEEDKTTLQVKVETGMHDSDPDQTRFEVLSSTPESLFGSQSSEILSNHSLEAYTDQSPAGLTSRLTHLGLNVGDVLKNRFKIVECLGQGGMGMVFKAQDIRKIEAKSHNPYVAIKVLNPELAQNQLLVAGLQRECEKAQELSHPNIITVYDFDRDGDLVYMSMEYLAGQSLNELISEAGGGISLQRAWPLILDMGTALAYAHRKGIVHSDFKPANVFITQDHKVKVLDFGIAARTENNRDNDATIFNARVEGGHTPAYASFEMMNGAKADPRDDIYAFGLVVYELLTGKHPYHRKSASDVFIDQQKNHKTAVPRVKGLSRRQWQALKSSIELLQDKRPNTLDDWLEQFNPKANRWSPQLLGGLVAAILLISSIAVNRWLATPADQTAIQDSTHDVAAVANSITTNSQKAPVADAGTDQTGQVGETLVLNGSMSQSGDGETLQYDWRLLQTPPTSKTSLQNSNTVNPQMTPDKAGEYLIELSVKDHHNSSLPVNVRITALEPAKPATLHQAISQDGILSLAASKAQFRIGEQLKLSLQVKKSGYIRVVYVGAAGEISELLPNQFQASKVKADTEFVIPPKGKFKLQITGPVGIDKIIAVYGDSPIPNLEKIIDADGKIDEQVLKNLTVNTIQYDVVK